MMLNSEQIIEKELLKLSEFSKLTQAGVDLSVFKIEVILKGGSVLKDKTIIDKENYEQLPLEYKDGGKLIGWTLKPGVYSCTFNEGINVPSNSQAKVTHRSSIYRMGNIIESPWWDAGFHCDNMNSTLIVHTEMFVEQNARLAQVVFHEMTETQKLYNGQWQGSSTAHGK
jgi:deoxycytidine triphosphate deaminase